VRSDSNPDYSFNNYGQVVHMHVPPSASSNVNMVIYIYITLENYSGLSKSNFKDHYSVTYSVTTYDTDKMTVH